MALRPYTSIEIIQQKNDGYPARQLSSFTLDFVNQGEIVSSWANLSDTCKIVIPYNIQVFDEKGNIVHFAGKAGTANNTIAPFGKNIYAGNTSPLFLRNDIVKVTLGYYVSGWDLDGTRMAHGREILYTNAEPQFTGYISKIRNKMPITLECEDEMFTMKQITCKNTLYSAKKYNAKTMLQQMLIDAGLSSDYIVTDGGINTNVGDFRVQNETIAD